MKPKQLPRLWCALQGLLPVEACLAAQQGELAWPRPTTVPQSTAVGSEQPIASAARARRKRFPE